LHFEGGLGNEIAYLLDHQDITATTSFWLLVFRKVFPPGMSHHAFDQALQQYHMWSEQVDLDRWDEVTRLIVSYQEMCTGKTGFELEAAVHQRMYRQLITVINACPTKQCQELMNKLETMQEPIMQAQDSMMIVNPQLYALVYFKFFAWLKLWVARFTYQGVFGYPQGGAPKKSNVRFMHPEPASYYPAPSAAPPLTPSAPIRTPTPAAVTPVASPTYAEMLATPEELHLRKLHTSVAAKQGMPGRTQSTVLEEYAPTGKKRTWTWMQRTKPSKPGTRMACNGPPPSTCTDPRIKYYGDWLDSQDLCSFCEKSGHVKSDCLTYHNTAKLTAEYSRRKAAGLPWPLTTEELKALLQEESTNSTQTA